MLIIFVNVIISIDFSSLVVSSPQEEKCEAVKSPRFHLHSNMQEHNIENQLFYSKPVLNLTHSLFGEMYAKCV